eukprot:10774040-Alexandrium_andersonii.AAC.1
MQLEVFFNHLALLETLVALRWAPAIHPKGAIGSRFKVLAPRSCTLPRGAVLNNQMSTARAPGSEQLGRRQ